MHMHGRRGAYGCVGAYVGVCICMGGEGHMDMKVHMWVFVYACIYKYTLCL